MCHCASCATPQHKTCTNLRALLRTRRRALRNSVCTLLNNVIAPMPVQSSPQSPLNCASGHCQRRTRVRRASGRDVHPALFVCSALRSPRLRTQHRRSPVDLGPRPDLVSHAQNQHRQGRIGAAGRRRRTERRRRHHERICWRRPFDRTDFGGPVRSIGTLGLTPGPLQQPESPAAAFSMLGGTLSFHSTSAWAGRHVRKCACACASACTPASVSASIGPLQIMSATFMGISSICVE